MDEEILILRKELFDEYYSYLREWYRGKIIDLALHYFLAMPNEKRKFRTSFEICLECCRIAKEHLRED